MVNRPGRGSGPVPTGTPEDLAWLRDRLDAAEYSEDAVCERLGAYSPAMLDGHHYPLYRQRLADADAGALFIRLFLLQENLSSEEARGALGPDAPERLEALGLVGLDRPTENGGQRPGLRSRVDLYPYRGLWIATDPSDRCGEFGGESLPDAVMDLNLSSHALAQVALPPAPGSRVLDLGTGCGVHALLAARAGATAVGADLNSRALEFARFNAALNGIENVSFVAGDLYAPVAGERFDRILVNPAFILSSQSRVLFRDGGPRGEAMSRRAIEGAVAHLAPRGVAQIVGEFPSIDGETFEERVAAWVAGQRCDLLLLRFSTLSAADYATVYSQEPFGQSPEAYEREWRERWDALTAEGIEEVAFGAVLLRRRTRGKPWLAARAATLETPLGERIAELLTVQDRFEDPQFPTAEDRPRLAPGVLLVDGRQWDGERWHVEEGHASLPDDPLLAEVTLGLGARALLLLCDGARTTAEIMAEATDDADDPADLALAARQALRELIERGIVVV